MKNVHEHLEKFGGHFQQLYYIIHEITKFYPQGLSTFLKKKRNNVDKEYFLRPNNPRELLQLEHLHPFFITYLKTFGHQSFHIYLHPECEEFHDNHTTRGADRLATGGSSATTACNTHMATSYSSRTSPSQCNLSNLSTLSRYEKGKFVQLLKEKKIQR